jgi:hypothetical protein
VEGKDKVLFAKWDFLAKHAGHKKAAKDIGIDVKKGDWYYSKAGLILSGICHFLSFLI